MLRDPLYDRLPSLRPLTPPMPPVERHDRGMLDMERPPMDRGLGIERERPMERGLEREMMERERGVGVVGLGGGGGGGMMDRERGDRMGEKVPDMEIIVVNRQQR